MKETTTVHTNTALVIFNRFNAIPRKGKSFKKPSLTVPKMDIKVSDLLKAYQQGMINSSNDPSDAEWNDDNPFAIGIDPKRLDLTELAIYKEQMENHIDNLSQQMHDKVKEGKTKLEEIKKAEAEKLKLAEGQEKH